MIDFLELAAVLFGFAYIWLSIRQHVGCWPVGLVSVALFLVVFYEARLYADVVLQAIYVVLSLYGWYYWLHGGREDAPAPVTHLPLRTGLVLAGLTVVGTAAAGWGFATYTDADLPYWDSTTTVLSLVAQWLAARKILENWVVWFVADTLYVGIYFYKGLYLTTGLFAVYVVLTLLGYRAWKASMTARPRPAGSAASS